MNLWLRWWGPVVVYAALIFYMSSQSHPDEELPSLFFTLFSDKVLHGFEYAVLGGLLYRAFRWGTNARWTRHALLLAMAAASLYGVSDEIHQLFVPFRESSWQDWMADTIGAALGAVVCRSVIDPDQVSHPLSFRRHS